MRQLYPHVRQIIFFILLIGNVIFLSAQDLPGVSANIKTAPAGSIVIAMDHTNQATSTINSATGSYLFNLKAYGLVTLLRNAGIYVNWVINTGKVKDGVDFTTTAERLYPSYVAAQSLSFRAGPFVIFQPDTVGVEYLVQWFNYSLPDSCKVKVYRTTADANVDVRYTLSTPPRIAMYHDSCDIHRNYMEMASVPTVNYDCVSSASGLISGCYTMVTVPHLTSNELSNIESDSIYNFVMAGGNLLAQCEGSEAFETRGKYQSSTGVVADPSGGQFANFNNNVFYDNPDMAYAQYQGTFKPWLRGAQKVWRYSSANTNNFYPVTSCKRNASDNLYYVAAVSKLTSGLGSIVFYLGNHEYKTYDCHTCLPTDQINEQEINGIRLYLNAIQIPTALIPCVVLDVKLGDLTATKQTNGSVLVKWNTFSESDNSYFIIEHSVDGKKFKALGKQFSKGNTGKGYEYNFIHTEPQVGSNFYRLRIVDINSKSQYSQVRRVSIGKSSISITVFPNPAKNNVSILMDANEGENLLVKFVDPSGRIVKQQKLMIRNQQIDINVENLNSGMYIVIVSRENGEQSGTKLMVSKN